ncbi:hypothetical protein AZE42_09831, partial [Rhizopogon vesiculosus]
MCCMPS